MSRASRATFLALADLFNILLNAAV